MKGGNIGVPRSLNRYAYSSNDPVNLVDPLGLNTTMVTVTTCATPYWGANYSDGHTEIIVGYTVCSPDVFLFETGGPSLLGDPSGGGDQDGKAYAAKMAKKFLSDLAKCIETIYHIKMKTFEESRPAMNGLFVGTDAKGVITVNDVGSYSGAVLSWIAWSPGTSGLTRPSTAREQTNYTARDLDPAEMFRAIQLHELGHSLDMITSGSIYGTSEKSADRILDCLHKK